MEKLHNKSYFGTPFRIETESIQNTPGTWNSTKVSIFRDNKLIGEYLRNYHDFAALTFYPFCINQEWYALYSANYTATRIMKLHEDRIEDWCGEVPSGSGFCPVEIYVPKYKSGHDKVHDYTFVYVDCDYKDDDEFIKESVDNGATDDIKFCNFGFLCGCVWGDDSSWKIRYIDLSKVPEKELSITDRFGYWEMPGNLSLKECIDMSCWEPDDQLIRLTKAEYFRLDK